MRRRDLLLASIAMAALLGACTQSGGGTSDAADMALGRADAPVTLIEYASVTCPHCRDFHHAVWEQLKREYIDTGRVRFIFREFPTAPAPVAVAGFQLARCGAATPEQYMTRIGVLMDQQQQILSSGGVEGIRAALIAIGQAAGLSEEQVMECINDEAAVTRIRRVTEEGNRQFNIEGTPTLVLNGRRLEDPSVLTWDGLRRVLDEALAAAG